VWLLQLTKYLEHLKSAAEKSHIEIVRDFAENWG
jgi:hypothetical protein